MPPNPMRTHTKIKVDGTSDFLYTLSMINAHKGETMQIQKSDNVRANVWGKEEVGFVLYILPDGVAMVDFGGVIGKHYIHTDTLAKAEA